MWERETEDVIERRMLQRMPNDIDKREGSIAFDSTKPAAVELMLMYAALDFFLKNTFGDTAEREYLIERAKDRGLKPYEATFASVTIETRPTDIRIPTGTRFSVDDLNYYVTKRLEDGRYLAQCETAGSGGNKETGRCIPIDYVRGLETANVVSLTVPGEDEEETEAFRERYLKSFETQAYGGNITDYQEKVGKLQGVGGVKVYPVWKGGGTVRIVFTTSENKVPNGELVKSVQEAIDPVTYQQLGVGIAPIGHRVTVEGAKESAIAIGLNIKFAGTDSFSPALSDIKATIQAYFSELNEGWQKTEVVSTSRYENRGIVVRISQIESRLLSRPYVSDISHTTLNGAEENVELPDDALGTIGDVTDISGG